MNRSDWLTDDLIDAAFERRAGRPAPVELRGEILAMTAATGQRAAWRLRLASAWSMPGLRPAWVALLVLAAILLAVLAIALVGQRSPRAHPGLLAYAQDGDVYLANPDGSGAIRAVHDPGVAFSAPHWSPDDRWLALEGGGGVFVLDPQTLQLRHLADGWGATWSSDGKSLAIVRSSSNGAGAIEIVEVETGATRELQDRLQPGQSVGVPLAWSPDGRWFLAPANAGSGKQFVRINAASGETVDIAPMYHLAEPGAHWSPDSRQFAYARPDDCGGNPPCQSSVVVVDADLSHAIAISDPTQLASNPVWSPDGTWIAFASSAIGDPAAQTLSIVRPDGRDLRDLAEIGGYGAPFSWSVDGGAVDVSEVDPTTGLGLGLSEVRISDRTKRPIINAPGVDSYDWQAIAAGLTIPRLPSVPASTAAAQSSTVPPQSPRAAPPADPSEAWSGLAIDSYCNAGWLDLRTLTERFVGPRCSEGGGVVVAAPLGTEFAVPELDGDLTIVQRDGSTSKSIGAMGLQPGSDESITWAPDGRWLSVPACPPGAGAECPQFLVISPDGRSQRSVPASPSWSPDGRRLVVKAQNGDLLVGSPDGSELRSVGTFPMPSSWSPDAAQFAFIRNGDAWIANADGTGQRNVTNFASGGADGASWSPDGRFLVVTQETRLWILAIDGGALRPIDLGPGRTAFYGDPVWSADSGRLAVVVQQGDAPSTLIVRAGDWTATALTGAGIDNVYWSPDGRFIAFLDQSSNGSQIDIANSDGSGRHTIWTGSDGASRVTWVP